MGTNDEIGQANVDAVIAHWKRRALDAEQRAAELEQHARELAQQAVRNANTMAEIRSAVRRRALGYREMVECCVDSALKAQHVACAEALETLELVLPPDVALGVISIKIPFELDEPLR